MCHQLSYPNLAAYLGKTYVTSGLELYFIHEPGSVFTNHSQEHSLSLSPRFANLNVTQLLIG